MADYDLFSGRNVFAGFFQSGEQRLLYVPGLCLAGLVRLRGYNQTMKSDPTAGRLTHLILPSTEDKPGVFCIVEKKRTSFYAFHELPCAIGGRGFAVHRLGLGSLYHVRVGSAEECSCECLGFLAHGRCRHILGLAALVRKGVV